MDKREELLEEKTPEEIQMEQKLQQIQQRNDEILAQQRLVRRERWWMRFLDTQHHRVWFIVTCWLLCGLAPAGLLCLFDKIVGGEYLQWQLIVRYGVAFIVGLCPAPFIYRKLRRVCLRYNTLPKR